MSKRISMNTLAKRSFQVDKKRYKSLIASIFLTIFFTATMFLAVASIFRRSVIQYEEIYGKQDAILLDAEKINDEELLESGYFKNIGNITVLGQLGDKGLTIGYYDEEACHIINPILLQGRLPKNPGEIAITNTAIAQLRLKVNIGDTVSLAVNIPDGQNGFLPEEEVQQYTLVGIVKDKLLNDPHVRTRLMDDRELLQLLNLFVMPGQQVSPGGKGAVHKVLLFSSKPMLSSITNHPAHDYLMLAGAPGINFYQFNLNDMGMGPTNNTDNFFIIGFILLIGLIFLFMGVVSIISSYTANLAGRKNEIGLLKAIGATQKQIRSLYNRETWLFIALTAPVGIGAAILFVWLLSTVAPGVFVLNISLGFVFAALAFSTVVIYLAAQIPLHQAAKTSPMQTLRDTFLLRVKRKTKVKSEKKFAVAALLAKRQNKLYKIKQVGITGVMAISILLLTIMAPMIYEYFKNAKGESPSAFDIYKGGGESMPFVELATNQYYFGEGEIGEILQLPLVSGVSTSKLANVNILLDGLSPYITHERVYAYLLTDEEKQKEGIEKELFSSYYSDVHRMIKNNFQITSSILQNGIVTIPDEMVQTIINEDSYEGKINIAALNTGEEVLLIAPKYLYDYWGTTYFKEEGTLFTEKAIQRKQQYSSQEKDDFTNYFTEKITEKITIIGQYKNDLFTPGMPLSLYQLYTENAKSVESNWNTITDEEIKNIKEVKANTKIGAIMSNGFRFSNYFYDGVMVVTTQQGLKALGIQNKGYNNIEIALSSVPDLDTEEYIQTQLENLALRGEGMIVRNSLVRTRLNIQMIWMVFIGTIAIGILFFFMTVTMVNTAITNRVRSDRCAIGTLRAVGADLDELTSSYFKQIFYMLVKGIVIGLTLGAIYIGVQGLYYEFYKQLNLFPWWMPFIYLGYLALVLLVCTQNCKKRLKEVMAFSIVENIRN